VYLLAQFKSIRFIYNNVRFFEHGFYVCTVEEGNPTAIIGTQRSVGNTDGGFYYAELTNPSFTLEIVKLNEKGNVAPLTNYDMKFLRHNLLTSEPAPLISEDNTGLIYYGYFTNITLNNNKKQGYLQADFEMVVPYAHTSVRHYSVRNPNFSDKQIEILCEDEIGNYIPDIVIETLQNSDIVIENLTNGTSITLSSIPQGHKLHIYGEGLLQMIDETEPTRNLFGVSNKKFMELQYGRNVIRVKGYANVDIQCQYRIGLDSL
jgi:phage-related protein